MAVVDVLEVVNVHQQQRTGELGVHAPADSGVVQPAAVGQPGQRVSLALGAQESLVAGQAAVERAQAPVEHGHHRHGQHQRHRHGGPHLLQQGAVVQLCRLQAAGARQLQQLLLLRLAVKPQAQVGQRGVAVGGHDGGGQLAFLVIEVQGRAGVTHGRKGVGKFAQGVGLIEAGPVAAVSLQDLLHGLTGGLGLTQGDAGQSRVVVHGEHGAQVSKALRRGQGVLYRLQSLQGATSLDVAIRQVGLVQGLQARRPGFLGQFQTLGCSTQG